ncbi:BatA domain-containing protein [Hymenobacter sp. 102]|uniref:BatA domain-containing protein n=1 Tax=Hymenobacter sp. 102 TaxID=3403152 RepID=UPI003CEC0E51
MAFVHPWFLLGLLAISIPVILHLFELRRPQRVLFSNVEFIQQVKLVTARQRKLKHLLLLASRIATVCCLVLLFAQPFIPAPEQNSGTVSSVRVVVDNSPSLQQLGANDQSLLEESIQQAVGLPLAFASGTRYHVWPGGQEPLTTAAYRAAVEQIQPSGQTESVGALLRQAQRSSVQGPIFLLSDFQKNTFSQASLAALDSGQQVFLIPLAGKPQPNVFVDSVWIEDAFIRAGADAVLQMRLRNGGQVDAANCGIKIFMGAQQLAAFQLTVPAGQTTVTQFKIRVPQGGVQEARVELDDYPVDFDNTYYFTLQPAAQIRITEISAAGELARLYNNEPLFAYQHVSPTATNYQALSTANLLILREVPRLSAGLRDNLRQAVQRGATLVVIPPVGAAGQADYAQFFRELGVGPVQWQPVSQGSPVLQDIATPSAQGPFFRDVFTGLITRAGMPKAAPVLRWSRSGTDVLRMRDGDNYLSGFANGAGSTYLFAAPFSAPYSDFAQHPLFVPVLYRLAMQSYRQEQRPAYRLSQTSVRLQVPRVTRNSRTEAVYQLVQDSLRLIPGQQEQAGTLRLDLPATIRQPGFYRLERAGETLTTLAFNVDKRESDLRSYTAAELRQLASKYPNVQVYETGAGQTAAARYKATRVGTPLWQYCVWGILIFLLVEILLLRLPQRRATPVAVPV